MTSDPYVNLYTSDFLAGTSGMTAATKGVYITLLCLMYESEAPLSQSWATLARRCGCTLPAFKKAMQDLEDDGKMTVKDSGIWSPKCDKHITRRRERQSSAKAAAEKRWQKNEQKQQPSNANAMRKGCQPEPEPEPEVNRDTNVSLGLSAPEPSSPLSEAVQRYNDAASKAGWPKVQKLTPARSKALKARLKECGGPEGWETALRKAFTSDFCRGRTAKPWNGFSFDWLTKQANFTKLMEGNYDNRTGDTSNESTADFARRIAERRAARRMDRGAGEGSSGALLPADHDGGHGRGGAG